MAQSAPVPAVFRSALLAFLVTRGIFFALTIVGSQMAFERKAFSGAVWETRVRLSAERLLPELERMAMTGDAWFYRSIAVDGYDGQNLAFFPLFPLTASVFGNFALAGMAIANLAFLGGLLLTGLITLRAGATPEDTERAVWYLAVFPTSYFCSLPLPESLFLLLSAGAFYAAMSGRWPVAGLLGGLAAATRFIGILLVVALVLLIIEQRERWRRALPWLLLIPAGTAAFMIYLQRTTGDALAFVTVQSLWERKASAPWEPLWDAMAGLPAVSLPWNFVALNLLIAILMLVAGITFLRERRWSFAAYVLGSLLVPLSSGSLQSLGRYAVVVFPLFLFLGVRGRSAAVDRTVLTTSLILFGWLVALFLLRVDLAMA